jgi:hypothetical protein
VCAVLRLSCAQVTDEDVAAIEKLGRHGGLFERLAASIAPEIFGMLEVKKVSGSVSVCIHGRSLFLYLALTL